MMSFAAEISLNVDKNKFIPNEDFLVQIYLDTQDISINAVEGVVAFPTDFLELKEIRDGNSAINFWVERPYVSSDRSILFSGITTGGLSLSKMYLFSLIFKTKKIGDGTIAFEGVKILKNDGMGTQVPVTTNSFIFNISKISDGSVPVDLTLKDEIPPEDFVPFLDRNSVIFDGKYFISFSTTDKGSGIDHFEVKESFLNIGGKYSIAESPYLLSDQTLKNTIYIKAVDKAGNEKIVKISAQNPLYMFVLCVAFGIILVVCIFLFLKIKHIFIH